RRDIQKRLDRQAGFLSSSHRKRQAALSNPPVERCTGGVNRSEGISVSPLVKKPEQQPVDLPTINANRARINLSFELTGLLPSLPNGNSVLNNLSREELPPPPQPKPQLESQQPQKVSEGGLRANAIIKVKPVYPQGAKMMNALGEVKVQII